MRTVCIVSAITKTVQTKSNPRNWLSCANWSMARYARLLQDHFSKIDVVKQLVRNIGPALDRASSKNGLSHYFIS